MRKILSVIMFCGAVALAGGSANSGLTPPAIGQVYATSSAGKLFAGRAQGGLDFNVWFAPANGATPRLIFNKTSLPQKNLALGAAFGSGQTVYVLVQRELTANTSDQEVYAINRTTGERRRVFRISDLGLLLALGDRFEYNQVNQSLVFSAARTQRAANGQMGQVTQIYEYGPMNEKNPRLRQKK